MTETNWWLWSVGGLSSIFVLIKGLGLVFQSPVIW